MKKTNSVEVDHAASRGANRSRYFSDIEMQAQIERCPAPWNCREECYARRTRCHLKADAATEAQLRHIEHLAATVGIKLRLSEGVTKEQAFRIIVALRTLNSRMRVGL